MCGAPAVASVVLDAAASWDGPIPGRDRVRIIIAGAPPPTRTIERIESELGWEFGQIYGLTETSPLLTMNRHRAEYDDLDATTRAQRLGRAGAPALGVRVRVDEEGEVLARSNVVFEGYWEQPDATAAAMAGDWFHTGDGGALDDDGYVSISDRKKDVIIGGGERVVDRGGGRAVLASAGCGSGGDGVPDEKWGETVKALVVLAPGATIDEGELLEHCPRSARALQVPHVGRAARRAATRTATGKLQKFKLREPYWEGHTRRVG